MRGDSLFVLVMLVTSVALVYVALLMLDSRLDAVEEVIRSGL